MYDILVLGGGGIKGISMTASLIELKKKNLINNIKKVVGTSIGSIIAAFIACNVSLGIIQEFLLKVNLEKLIEIDIELFFKKYGFNNFEYLKKILKITLKKLNLNEDINFKDLYSYSSIELIITGANITKGKTDYFSYKKSPKLKIIDAILISTAYPIASVPIVMNNNYYCDGGLTSPFPTEIIKKKEKDRTIGITFKRISNPKIESITDYINSFIEVMIISLVDLEIKRLKNCIVIYSDEIAMNLDINDETKKRLINDGIKYTHLFFKEKNL